MVSTLAWNGTGTVAVWESVLSDREKWRQVRDQRNKEIKYCIKKQKKKKEKGETKKQISYKIRIERKKEETNNETRNFKSE
jgi:hypothetical protein